MPTTEADIELLDTYLDGELSPDEVMTLDRRLAGEPELKAQLALMRAGYEFRRIALGEPELGDAAAVERLVGAVRAARASEALRQRRWGAWAFPAAAAACLLVGATVGRTLNNGGDAGVVAPIGPAGGFPVAAVTSNTGGGAVVQPVAGGPRGRVLAPVNCFLRMVDDAGRVVKEHKVDGLGQAISLARQYRVEVVHVCQIENGDVIVSNAVGAR